MERIIGRDEELRVLGTFLERPREIPEALVLEGEAGIGKTTLWLAGVEEAEARGLRVLASRPAEVERELAFAGLGDLLEPVLDEATRRLAPPRKRALEIALLLEETTEATDERALALAVRDALEALTEEGQLAVAIDDVQWLDPSSSAALAFALRRLEVPLAVLVARRVTDGGRPSELERVLAARGLASLRVGPLSLGAIQALLREQLDRAFSRPTVLRIHETSGGNPFFALELARALGPEPDPTRPPPVPDSLERLVEMRLGGLPESARQALALVAAVGNAEPAVLRGAGVDEDTLEPAFAAGVIEQVGWEIRFTHPLLASVLYQALPATERRRAHESLARVVRNPVDRARHLALSADAPSAGIAAVLEEASALATARGAPIVAAELAEHALRLTPRDSPRDGARRAIAAGRAQLAAGDAERARALGRELQAREPRGLERAEALIFLSELDSGRMDERVRLRRAALEEPSTPAELRLRIHQRLALELRFTEGASAALEHARAALDIACELGDDGWRAGASAVLALLQFTAGMPDALRLAEEAQELAAPTGSFDRVVEAGLCLSHILVWSDERERARAVLDRLVREGRKRDERVAAQALWYLALVEVRSGRLDAAWDFAAEARELGVQYARDDAEDPQSLFGVALVAAYRGDLEVARELAARGHELAELQGALLPGLAAVLALAAAWRRDGTSATEWFGVAEQTADRAGWAEPGLRWWRADLVETRLELGSVEEATGLLDDWEEIALRLNRPWVLAQAKRCRGLAAAARGDVSLARSTLAEAAVAHEAIGDPVGQGRALLALGMVARRARQKRAAREAIEAAAAIFDRCGAHGWAAKARSEGGRIGGRRAEEGLTPAETRVAALVAEGRTNREVAATLFVGERTVETHLSHIYSKLGIRSRTELARAFRDRS